MPIDPALLHGASLLAQSALRGSREFPPIPSDLERLLGAAMRELPPQWFEIGRYQASGAWIELAALIESSGCFDDAWDLLTAMAEVVERAVTSDGYTAQSEGHRATLLAFLWARRGRVSRMAGRLDDADVCYGEALAHRIAQSHDAYWSDVYPWAWIGRSVLAVERGNYPAARQCARKALQSRVPTGHQARAHVMLALIDRKQRRLDRALHHLWSAHDLSDGHPVHQAEIVVALAEVALQLGDTCAAIRAWNAVLAQHRSPRLVNTSLVGLMDAQTLQWADGDRCGACSQLIGHTAWLEPFLTDDNDVPRALAAFVEAVCEGRAERSPFVGELARHDAVELQMARAKLLFAVGEAARAVAIAENVRTEAEQFGFHERVFQLDALLQWASKATSDGVGECTDEANLVRATKPSVAAEASARRVRVKSGFVSQVKADLARCFTLELSPIAEGATSV